QVAKDFGISRVTVRKYVEEAVPGRKETAPRGRPVREKVGPRVEALLAESPQWTGGKQQLGYATARAARRRRPPGGRHAGQRDGGRVETAPARGVRAADVSGRRSRGSRFLRGPLRSRRDSAQGVALLDATDVLRPRFRVDHSRKLAIGPQCPQRFLDGPRTTYFQV